MPLIGAPQGQHNWWTKGLAGSRRTPRNWTGGWTTSKSVAQEGRKVKPIVPTIPSRFTDRKTSRTNLTTLKPAEEFFFLFSFFFSFSLPPKFLLPFYPSFFFLFLLPSFTFLFILHAFFYFFILIYVKIPSFHSSNLFLFLLPSFISFSIPFFLLLPTPPPFPQVKQ